MSFQDSAFIFFIALLLFGPKKLPELARQLGKLMGEFRRASNEFRMQLDDELRSAEQAEKQKKIAALEAAAPPPVTASADPADELAPHPHAGLSAPAPAAADFPVATDLPISADQPEHTIAPPSPQPIATSGELALHSPASGLPVGRNGSVAQTFDSVPEAPPDRSLHANAGHTPDSAHRPAETPRPAEAAQETAQHG